MAMRDQDRLRTYLDHITRGAGGIESLPELVMRELDTGELAAGGRAAAVAGETELGAQGGKILASARGEWLEAVHTASRKLAAGNAALSSRERFVTEAIIIPGKRPAFDIVDGDFRAAHPLWRKLSDDEDLHARLCAAIPAIGRVELPGQSQIPYAGTGFVVGQGLLMTNRHVAEIFALGVGDRRLRFRDGMRAGLDLRQERGRPAGRMLDVRAVRMIHPWWDMALLEVEGLPGDLEPLQLSTDDARDLAGQEIVVIGYPAYDPLRNDPEVQDQIFDRTYGVKRLQPGYLHQPRQAASFGRLVDAATHDCSTLGGESGSALVDPVTGRVLGLHFGGRYLDINVAVSSGQLAQDGRVWDAGVQFVGARPTTLPPDWLRAWQDIEVTMRKNDDATDRGAPPATPRQAADAVPPAGHRVTFEVPLRITVELGAAGPAAATVAASDTTERMVEPKHDTDYRSRRGYDPGFLRGVTVPMPKARDPRVLAPLKTGGTELAYENFSILMHGARRLALVTAANVSRETHLRQPEPGRSYTRKVLGELGRNDQEKWFEDPRLEPDYQLSDIFFTRDDGAFDKGHIVRRDDVAFGGSYAAVQRANGDTYHVTNCSPQVARFNQSGLGEDNWGDLENLVLAEAASERLAVFGGPVLDPADETFVGRAARGQILRVRIPSRYWKVIVARTEQGIAAYAFILEQDLGGLALEFVVGERFRRLQVPLAEIEAATGLDFGDEVRAADSYDGDRGQEAARRGGLVRVPSLAGDLGSRPTPNSGDDADAEPNVARAAPAVATEAPPSWRVARALEMLRQQVDASAPQRSRLSDGTIGDAAHASRDSDHNPWVRDGAFGVVTALDITHDPAGGCDAGRLAEVIVASRDARVKYVISNRRIASSDAIGGSPAWVWRPYKGRNPHTKHVHVSVHPDKAAYDSTATWQI